MGPSFVRMPVIVNLSTYKFVPLSNLPELREAFTHVCREQRLKGTILLSSEGINVFVAGSREAIDKLLVKLRATPGLEDLAAKESVSDTQPYNRMLVKIKKEIIAFGVDGIDPARRPTTKLAPETLKQWLDEGRPITLLDTRNHYEVRMGTFHGAVAAGIRHFREFPKAVAKLPEDMKEQPVVMFCTGGIRCEKAGPFMERAGFKEVFQLDGGILKYFEQCGGAHYAGECFVFDQRVGVNPELRPTGSVQCFNCQMPLSTEDQKHPHYIFEKSCPFCHGARESTTAQEQAGA